MSQHQSFTQRLANDAKNGQRKPIGWISSQTDSALNDGSRRMRFTVGVGATVYL